MTKPQYPRPNILGLIKPQHPPRPNILSPPNPNILSTLTSQVRIHLASHRLGLGQQVTKLLDKFSFTKRLPIFIQPWVLTADHILTMTTGFVRTRYCKQSSTSTLVCEVTNQTGLQQWLHVYKLQTEKVDLQQTSTYTSQSMKRD